MLTELGRRMGQHSENFNKEIQNVRKYQTEVINEVKNTLEGFSSRLDEIEEQISELEDKAKELIQTEQQNEERILKSGDTLRDFWENIKWNNICITGVSEGEEREKGPEIFEEIMDENFPNLRKETDIQVQEAQKSFE